MTATLTLTLAMQVTHMNEYEKYTSINIHHTVNK